MFTSGEPEAFALSFAEGAAVKRQRGVFNVGLVAFLAVGAAAVAVCLSLWSYYETRHKLDARSIAEAEAKYKTAHGELTTCVSEVAAVRLANTEFGTQVKKQNEAIEVILKEREDASLKWRAERDAANRARVAAGKRMADLLNLVPPEGFVEQCKALEKLRLEYRP